MDVITNVSKLIPQTQEIELLVVKDNKNEIK